MMRPVRVLGGYVSQRTASAEMLPRIRHSDQCNVSSILSEGMSEDVFGNMLLPWSVQNQ